ncbi:MAG: hypothetical protein KAY65_05405 [Planctomycetes bacterium]|nr:hypothetical protein [Planctomycetota bacterium]
MLLVEAGAKHQFQAGSTAYPGERAAFFFLQCRLDPRRPVGRALQDPVPPAIIDCVVAKVAAQSHTVADIRKAFLGFTLSLGRKSLFAGDDRAAQDQLNTFFQLGGNQLQTLLHLVAEVLDRFALDGQSLHFGSVRTFGADGGVENSDVMISQFQSSLSGIPRDLGWRIRWGRDGWLRSRLGNSG